MSDSNTPNKADVRLQTLTDQHFSETKNAIQRIISDLPVVPGINYDQLLLECLVAVQTTSNLNGDPALKVCTKSSIDNAVIAALTRRLSPALGQCYFIVRGTNLTMMASVFGDLFTVYEKTGYQGYTMVVKEADTFETVIRQGKTYITKHESDPRSDSPPCGAYLGLTDREGKDLGIHYMSLDRIRKSWEMSPQYRSARDKYEAVLKSNKPDDAKLPLHEQFLEDFMQRTVTRAGLKWILRTAGGAAASALEAITDIVEAQDVIDADYDLSEANSQVIDVSGLEEVDEIQDTSEQL